MITFYHQVNKTILKQPEKVNLSIMDGTACCGGNSIIFKYYFKHVYAIEYDQARYDLFKHNISSVLNFNVIEMNNDDKNQLLPFDAGCENTSKKILKKNKILKKKNQKNHFYIKCDSYLNVMNKIQTDIIFLDAPWGGIDYKDKKLVQLFLGSKSIGQICNELFQYFQNQILIILKIPNNFNEQLFKKFI